MLYHLYYTKHNSRRRRNMTIEDIKDYAAAGISQEIHFVSADGKKFTLDELISKEENVKDITPNDHGGLFAGIPRTEPVSEDTSGELFIVAGGDSE